MVKQNGRGRWDWILKWWPVLTGLSTTAAVLIGGALVGDYRVQQAEAKIAKLEAKLETKADATDVAQIKLDLTDVRLDLGQLCAAQFGAEKCFTARRPR